MGSPTTLPLLGSLKSSTMPCWRKLVSITTPATTTSWELPAENTSGCARCPSPTPATATSSEPCLALSQKQQLESRCLKIVANLLPMYWRLVLVNKRHYQK